MMLQDECRDLSIDLSSKPDAMVHTREAAAAISHDERDVQIHTAAVQAMQTKAADMAGRVLESPLKLGAELDAAHALLREALSLLDQGVATPEAPFKLRYKWLLAEGDVRDAAVCQQAYNAFAGTDAPTPAVTVMLAEQPKPKAPAKK